MSLNINETVEVFMTTLRKFRQEKSYRILLHCFQLIISKMYYTVQDVPLILDSLILYFLSSSANI